MSRNGDWEGDSSAAHGSNRSRATAAHKLRKDSPKQQLADRVLVRPVRLRKTF
jgi:hypothetical protein